MLRPAIIGGPSAFTERLPIARPYTPPLDDVVARLEPSYKRGMLTNSDLVREFEDACADRLGVEHAVAVSSCTAGLMLTLRALLAVSGPAPAVGTRPPVVLPSFTFSASAHAVAWNGASPRFAECDSASFQLDTTDAASRVEGAGAVLATHVFGAPCDAEEVERVAAEAGVPAIFDAAHGFGARRAGRPVGSFGDAEVFSLSPTKVVIGGEGGVVATDREDLAAAVRLGRDYGNPGDYDTRFVGLNARMSELHAAVALASLALLDEHLALRQEVAERYRQALADVPGVRTQVIAAGDVSTYKDFTIAVDEAVFGVPRDAVVRALSLDGIDTRCYFSPPVHRQQAYAGVGDVAAGELLAVTDLVSRQVVSLPMFATIGRETADRVADVLRRLHHHAEEVTATWTA